jgi:hypothetical protein
LFAHGLESTQRGMTVKSLLPTKPAFQNLTSSPLLPFPFESRINIDSSLRTGSWFENLDDPLLFCQTNFYRDLMMQLFLFWQPRYSYHPAQQLISIVFNCLYWYFWLIRLGKPSNPDGLVEFIK